MSACIHAGAVGLPFTNIPRPEHREFDLDDGPGHLSRFGPRHDNDHAVISKIQVLPTTDEILSVHRPPYMPKKNLAERHFLPAGPSRLFDVLFRHLRYNHTECIRDICYHAFQALVADPVVYHNYQAWQETPVGNRYFLYRHTKVEEVHAQDKKGLLVKLSYACPKGPKYNRAEDPSRFQNGMLCALLGLEEGGTLTTTFLEVCNRGSAESMRRKHGNRIRAAVQLSFVSAAEHVDVFRILRYARGLVSVRTVLVEFPKLLLAGFYWCLTRLQEFGNIDLAFSRYIAPYATSKFFEQAAEATKSGVMTVQQILPPACSQRSGHAWDLSCLSKDGRKGVFSAGMCQRIFE